MSTGSGVGISSTVYQQRRRSRERASVAPERHAAVGSKRTDDELDVKVVQIRRVSNVVKGGRRFSYSALVVVGDHAGRVGVGLGKSVEVPAAIEKGAEKAKKGLIQVALDGTTIPYAVIHKFSASHVMLKPAAPGTGVIAGSSVRAVIEAAGIRDVLTKSLGSSNPHNTVSATLGALMELRTRQSVLADRGKLASRASGSTYSIHMKQPAQLTGSARATTDRRKKLAEASDSLFKALTLQPNSDSYSFSATSGTLDASNEEIDTLLQAFLRTHGWKEIKRILLKHKPVLLSERASLRLNGWIQTEEQAGRSAEHLKRSIQLLVEAKSVGIESAISERVKESRMSIPFEIQLLLARLDQLAEVQDYDRRIELLEMALSSLPRNASPTLWAIFQAELGLSLAMHPTKSRVRELTRALRCFEEALKVIPPEQASTEWPVVLYNELHVLRELADLSDPDERDRLLQRAESRVRQLGRFA